jgi:two-component system sensor histidine kinase YesM
VSAFLETPMNTILSFYDNLSLKKKLIALFIGFIVIPAIVLILFLIAPTSQAIRDMAVKSAVRSNEQIIKNLDTFIGVLSKLSEYPISDRAIYDIMRRHQSGVKLSELDKSRDFRTMNTFAFTKIKSFSPLIDSVILFDPVNNRIFGRSPAEYLNMDYFLNHFGTEPWLEKTIELQGDLLITGIRPENLMTSEGEPVVSVARSIIDTQTRQTLGIVIINVGVLNLERLWMDIKITENSRFYLTDGDNRVIFSKNPEELGIDINEVLGTDTILSRQHHGMVNVLGQYSYLISSSSPKSSWRAITIIPTDELFSYINVMLRIALIAITIGVLTSILIAVFIATGITKPLYSLNQKMKKVGEGNLDIFIDDAKGEVGQIAKTIRKMLHDIKLLITRIYSAEKEKRDAEMLALQSQINPHFLYNTLNSIKWLAHMQGATAIENSIASLSSMLAFAAKNGEDFIPVREEVKFVKDYIEILNLRYYNKFTVSYNIDPEVYNYKTLKFLLQPVIENAVLHGFEGLGRKGHLQINLHHIGNKLVFEVSDNGNGIEEAILKTILEKEDTQAYRSFNSIGLSNIKKRLELHFGEGYGLFMQSTLGEGTVARIIIPEVRIEPDAC